MATNNTKVMIGAGKVSIGAYVASGGAGSLTDVGHTAAPIELQIGFENADLVSERALGIIDTKPIAQTMGLVVPMLEITPERFRIAIRQPTANLSGGTLRFDDAAKQFHQIQIVNDETVDATYTSLTVTIWKAQVAEVQPVQFAKGAWTTLNVTFRVLKDDTVATADKYAKFVWA